MTIFNPKSEGVREKAHANFMGGNSWDISNPLTRLRIAASSCFFGEPMYYHRDEKDTRKLKHTPKSRLTDSQVKHLSDSLGAVSPSEWRGLSPSELIERCIDEALNFDAEGTLKEAARLRNEDHIRTTPQVILVRASNNMKVKGSGLVQKYAPQIIRRADEPAVCLAYQLHAFGRKHIPNSLKKALRKSIENFSEFQLSKYRLESRKVKTVDVINLTHPKSEAASKLVKGELSLDENTWEAFISKNGSTKESWEKAVDLMQGMSLTRNLRNLIEKGVPTSKFAQKLVDTAAESKQLPFRYYSAYKSIEGIGNAEILDAVEQAMENSLGNTPTFKGRTISLCDNSGSAQGTTTSSMGSVQISSIANLTGIITGKNSDDGYIGIFGDRLEVLPVRKKSSIMDQLKKADAVGDGIGLSTENGIWLFLDKAIKEKEHWDNIFIYSDMQAGHGGLYGLKPADYSAYRWAGNYIDVAKLVSEYRSKVNPNVNVFLVQVAGQVDTIIPEFYNKTYILGGWGEGILKFAHSMIESPQQ